MTTKRALHQNFRTYNKARNTPERVLSVENSNNELYRYRQTAIDL